MWIHSKAWYQQYIDKHTVTATCSQVKYLSPFSTRCCPGGGKRQHKQKQNPPYFSWFTCWYSSSFSFTGRGCWEHLPYFVCWGLLGLLDCSSSMNPPLWWHTCSPSSTLCKECSSSSSTAFSRKRYELVLWWPTGQPTKENILLFIKL